MDFQTLFNTPIFQHDEYEFLVFDLLMIILTLVVARLVMWVIGMMLKRNLLRRKRFDKGRLHATRQIIMYFVYTLAVILCLEISGLDVTLLIAGSTALLVGIGFGLQNTFNDLVSGIILLFEGSIKVGDVIEIEGLVGQVKHIGIRTSKIETRDNMMLIVPNSSLVSNRLNNWADNNKRMRFAVTVGVDYSSDVELVRDIILKTAVAHPEVLDNPAPFVRFENFGDSSLDFQLFFYSMEKLNIENVRSDLRFAIRKAFQESNIKIPFPQRDLHIISGGKNLVE